MKNSGKNLMNSEELKQFKAKNIVNSKQDRSSHHLLVICIIFPQQGISLVSTIHLLLCRSHQYLKKLYKSTYHMNLNLLTNGDLPRSKKSSNTQFDQQEKLNDDKYFDIFVVFRSFLSLIFQKMFYLSNSPD